MLSRMNNYRNFHILKRYDFISKKIIIFCFILQESIILSWRSAFYWALWGFKHPIQRDHTRLCTATLPRSQFAHVWNGANKKATAVKQVIELCRRGFDVFINTCDGAWDEDRAGIEVIDVLLRFNQAFTGANKEFFDPARETQKKVANYYGVLTPGFCFCYDMDSVRQATQHLKFPVICKHFNS